MSDPFVDERHALYCGWVMGIALRHDLPFTPVVDEHGDYLGELALTLPDGTSIVLVIPYPPDDWALVPERNPDDRQSD